MAKQKAKLPGKRKAPPSRAESVITAAADTAAREHRRKAQRKRKPARDAGKVVRSRNAAPRPSAPDSKLRPGLITEAAGQMASLGRLERAVREVDAGSRDSFRTRKLIGSGMAKMAQKVIEEAAEVAIEGIRKDRAALISESVDLFYNLVVLWSQSGVALADIWAEMDRREMALGMAEKLPKPSDDEG